MRGVKIAAAACIVGLTAAGCGGGARHAVRGVHMTLCAPGSVQRVGTRTTSLAAVAVHPLNAFAQPGRGPFARFGLLNVNGVPTVFSVLERRVDGRCRPTWLHVELPVRPNGATGWVQARAVETAPVHVRIVVDLSERRVRLYRNGRLVLSSPAAVG